jgi:hypothetical protein
MSKEPLSIEILLQEQKEQREAAAKVTFSKGFGMLTCISFCLAQVSY